jgi:TRAP-type C4-dicarboxylate transport system substrate-binding protein
LSEPIKIRLGGYGPSTTSFSLALKRIGERLESDFGNAVDVKYVWNILDLGYRSEDILWLVEDGFLTLGYQSSSYFTEKVPAVGSLDLPFVFQDRQEVRGLMDGDLGKLIAAELESRMDLRILGFFENGLRHVSNKVRPINTPADFGGMSIRVLPSEIQARTFELLGATPLILDLVDALERVVAGTIDAQENPLANTVTYGAHKYHRYHTLTGHSYLSRPVFVHRPSFDRFPEELQSAMRQAVRDAVAFQRELKVAEEEEARREIVREGGEVVELSESDLALFRTAVAPIYDEARKTYSPELLELLPGF